MSGTAKPNADLVTAVRAVLAGQSPGYAIFPNASAFIAEGLDPEAVADVLAWLHEQGLVEREALAPEGDDDGATIPGGYRLTPKGAK